LFAEKVPGFAGGGGGEIEVVFDHLWVDGVAFEVLFFGGGGELPLEF
jgi:hypothetical protein